MDTKETYEYLREHYSNTDPRALEQVTSLYQCADGLYYYRRILNLLMTTYQMAYGQAQIDELTGANALHKEEPIFSSSIDELDTLLAAGLILLTLKKVWCPYTGHRPIPCRYAVVISVRGNLNGIYTSNSLEDCKRVIKAVASSLEPRIVECVGYQY